MSESKSFFEGWSSAKKLSLGLATLLILALVAGLGWWAQHQPKAVLFADLAERDLAVLAAELDKLKTPYQLGENGRSILVAADAVHRTRMTLMSKQLPLHGVVGFELFNNADFGVSDFVQKVNYQRALQGELTRTILAIDQVEDARVHLALPEQTLFKKDGNKAKASVTVSLKGEQSLQAGQVAGIQRLVAASVPDIRADDVTVLDQHGVVLSRAGGEESNLAVGQLDARQTLEAHLTRKLGRLLEEMFNPGESIAVVDVVLNHEQSKVTTEDVLGTVSSDRGSHPAGVVSHERTVTKESSGEGSNAAPQTVTQETDFQNGKRTAQTFSQGGQIERLSVAVVVKRQLDAAELARLKALITSAVGIQTDRGDSVAIHSLGEQSSPSTPRGDAASVPAPAVQRTTQTKADVVSSGTAIAPGTQGLIALAIVLTLAALVALGFAWRQRNGHAAAAPALSGAEREALRAKLRQWLDAGELSA